MIPVLPTECSRIPSH